MDTIEILGQLHEDHQALAGQFGRLEDLLNQRRQATSEELGGFLEELFERLLRHIRFEEANFYAPLKASGQARLDLMERLSLEHEDLLATLGHLKQLKQRGVLLDEEEFLGCGCRLIEVYRAHTEREHRLLFPLLEQCPGSVRPSFITRQTTLNAMIRQFPKLLDVLHMFRLDCRWFGSETLEEAAWYHGMPVENLLEALNRSIVERS